MMSEKIVITVEQDEQIKSWKNQFGGNEKLLGNHTLNALTNTSQWGYEFQSLTALTIGQMARILYEPNSYEVEPKFKLDDLVVTTYENKRNITGRVTKFIDNVVRIRYSDNGEIRNGGHNLEHIRHATKEEIMWAELGREVGEFVEGDIGVGTPNNRYEDLSNLSTHYKNGSLKGFYPANSFIEFP